MNKIKEPIILIPSLAASATKKLRSYNVKRLRTLTVTARCTYNASGTNALRINIYFSPDGINFDTIAYTYMDVTITAGSTCQRTVIIDPPEQGHLQIEAKNQDSSYAVTDVQVWIGDETWEVKPV